jgi:hypothetical protein
VRVEALAKDLGVTKGGFYGFFAERLRRVDNRRMDLLREAIGTFCADEDEVEARAMLAFCLAIGEHFLAADHNGQTRAGVLTRATDVLFARA